MKTEHHNNLISLKDEADRRGLTTKALAERCRGGQEPLARKGPNGRWGFIEGECTEDDFELKSDIPDDAKKDELDRLYKYWQARKTRSEAKMKEYEQRRLSGGLVDKSSLEKKWKGSLLSIRTQMLTVPDIIRRELSTEIIDDFAYRKIRDIVDAALIAASEQK